MKQVIVMLAVMVLAIFIGSVVILGDTDSFKSDAQSIGTEAKSQITDFIGDL